MPSGGPERPAASPMAMGSKGAPRTNLAKAAAICSKDALPGRPSFFFMLSRHLNLPAEGWVIRELESLLGWGINLSLRRPGFHRAVELCRNAARRLSTKTSQEEGGKDRYSGAICRVECCCTLLTRAINRFLWFRCVSGTPKK